MNPTNLLWLAIGVTIGGYGLQLVMFCARVVDDLLHAHTPNARLGDLLLDRRTFQVVAGLPRQRERYQRAQRGRHAIRRR